MSNISLIGPGCGLSIAGADNQRIATFGGTGRAVAGSCAVQATLLHCSYGVVWSYPEASAYMGRGASMLPTVPPWQSTSGVIFENFTIVFGSIVISRIPCCQLHLSSNCHEALARHLTRYSLILKSLSLYEAALN